VKQYPFYKYNVPNPVDSQFQTAAVAIRPEDADGVDLTDQVVVVTGANSGVGKQVATYAAAKGARVYMLCRNLERAELAKSDMMAQIQAAAAETTKKNNDPTVNMPDKNTEPILPQIEIVVVNVAELAQVQKAAELIQSKESKIHALVCNAGVLLNDRTETKEGYESTFATHLLGGTYWLSQLLTPQLQQAEGGRAIFVTSGGMYNFKLPPWHVLTSSSSSATVADSGDNVVPYNGVNVYAYAKRAQVLLAERWTRDIPNVMWVTVHPGWTDTPALSDAFGSGEDDMRKYLMPLREPWQGAEGIAWLVGTDVRNLQSGELYLDRKVQPKHLAGPFFTQGKYTKNSVAEVDDFMENLKKACSKSD
jgi:dehydrogenase/reductase SDR family member 12